MSDGAIHEMSRVVGALQADVRSLKETVDTLNKTWGDRERGASQQRGVIHDKLDEVRVDVTRLAAEVVNLSKDVAVIKPAIETFRSARERQLGAQRMGKLIWLAFIGIAGAVGGAIVQLIHYLRA